MQSICDPNEVTIRFLEGIIEYLTKQPDKYQINIFNNIPKIK